MNPKLRILTIRLLHKMAEHPEYAAWVGVEGSLTRKQLQSSKQAK